MPVTIDGLCRLPHCRFTCVHNCRWRWCRWQQPQSTFHSSFYTDRMGDVAWHFVRTTITKRRTQDAGRSTLKIFSVWRNCFVCGGNSYLWRILFPFARTNDDAKIKLSTHFAMRSLVRYINLVLVGCVCVLCVANGNIFQIDNVFNVFFGGPDATFTLLACGCVHFV